mgnify:CR=1 FL=1
MSVRTRGELAVKCPVFLSLPASPLQLGHVRDFRDRLWGIGLARAIAGVVQGKAKIRGVPV